MFDRVRVVNSFNTQPPEGGWLIAIQRPSFGVCFNTQPPEGGWRQAVSVCRLLAVSTHSRPKAAGKVLNMDFQRIVSFNTQPPEGGWEDNFFIVISFR